MTKEQRYEEAIRDAIGLLNLRHLDAAVAILKEALEEPLIEQVRRAIRDFGEFRGPEDQHVYSTLTRVLDELTKEETKH